jgi:hypothetical protein
LPVFKSRKVVNAVTESASALTGWSNFYVIVGSSGGALIGLQFVVMTLIADRGHHTSADALGAFGTPTVVHLAGALMIAAIMSAPWPSLYFASIAIMVCGLIGLAYGAVVIRRAHRQTTYQPVWQDWLWYTLLPCSAYTALTLTAAVLRSKTQVGLFVIAAAALGLLLIGIHNAWDTVTHLVVTTQPPGKTGAESDRRSQRAFATRMIDPRDTHPTPVWT